MMGQCENEVHEFAIEQLATVAEVDAQEPPSMGTPGRYVWAWEDEAAGRIRARVFPVAMGIAEDEATGAAALRLGAELGRPLTLRQGVGSRIDVQPTGAPSLVVSVSHVRVDPALTVGATVTAAGSKLGTIVDFSHVERQSLARYTNDSGNHVVVEVRPSAALSLG